jgi:hypothetical protein
MSPVLEIVATLPLMRDVTAIQHLLELSGSKYSACGSGSLLGSKNSAGFSMIHRRSRQNVKKSPQS